MPDPFSLLFALVIIALLAFVLFTLLAKTPIPEPARTVLTVGIVLVVLIVVVRYFGLM